VTRNIATFSTDIDTFDFKLHKPEDVINSAMTKLAKNGKGILLMHDFHHNTAEALPELLRQLKAGGYKIVHMVPKEPVTTLAKYDDMVRAQNKILVRQQYAPRIERRQNDKPVKLNLPAD
jgi:3-dehydroquinate dehydratase